MAETDFTATSSGRYRTSRYPGFVGGRTDASGNVVAVAPSSNPNPPSLKDNAPASPSTALGSITSNDIQVPETPSLGSKIGDLAKSAAGLGAVYAGTEIGRTAGHLMDTGAANSSLEALSLGAKDFGGRVVDTASEVGKKIGNVFGGEAASSPMLAPPSNEWASGVELPHEPSGLADYNPLTEGESLGSQAGEVAQAPGLGEIAGGAIGGGLITAAVGLMTGEKPEQALAQGAGVGLGYAGGAALGAQMGFSGGGPIGAVAGGLIGAIIGGRVICTELVRQGLMDQALLDDDRAFTAKHIGQTTVVGYLFWAEPWVRVMRRHDWIGHASTVITRLNRPGIAGGSYS